MRLFLTFAGMQPLSSSLLAHQRGTHRRPAVQVRGLAQRFGVRVLRWERYYAGTEPDSPHAAALAADGSLLRARNDGGTLFVQRVPSPGPASTYSSWTNVASVTAGTGVALCARSGEALLAYIDGGGLNLRVRSSSDGGASWSAATLLVSEGSAISSVAVAFRPNGDACVFYTLSASTILKSLRRTGGAWAGSGTTWSRGGGVASLAGLAACHDGGDFSLVVTGAEATTLHPRAWAVRMGDGLLPAGSWSALTAIAEADAASTTTFAGPAILSVDGDVHAAFAQRETGNVSADRIVYTHPPHATDVNGRWTEPATLEAAGANGIALAAGGAGAWLTTPSGVWFAATPAPDVLSERILACSVEVRPASARARVVLDNSDGALTALPNDDFPATMTGSTVELAPGYLSGADGAAEYGAVQRFAIERVRYLVERRGRLVILEGVGGWEQAARWHAPQAWQTGAGALSRDEIFAYIAQRAGVAYATGGRLPSGDWSSGSPSFALLPGESAATALRRLLAVVSDGVRADGDQFVLTGCSPADDSDYAYGSSAHPLARFELLDGAPEVNSVRLQGPDRYAEVADYASVAAHGSRLAQLRNLDATTDASAIAMAAGALREAKWSTRTGTLVAPCNVGQQLFDVVTVTSDTAGVARDFRVLSCAWEYVRAGSGEPRLDTILELGEL